MLYVSSHLLQFVNACSFLTRHCVLISLYYLFHCAVKYNIYASCNLNTRDLNATADDMFVLFSLCIKTVEVNFFHGQWIFDSSWKCHDFCAIEDCEAYPSSFRSLFALYGMPIIIKILQAFLWLVICKHWIS